MRSLAPLVAVGIGTFLIQQAHCEAPSRPRMEETRKLRARLRELNEELREATGKARREPGGAEAFKAVRAAVEELRKAQERANKLLDEAIVTANPDLAEAVRERRDLQNKVADRRRLLGQRRRPGLSGSEEPEEERKSDRKDGGPDVGEKAPDFSLQTMDGEKTVKLSDSQGRKPVVLIFASYT